ncbi:MAG: helix-turn-helix domain-containing protein [Woeseiaceae bacterium]|nr:helix-turn-helix domain-containing protein [Woeseiaceae bacterium]
MPPQIPASGELFVSALSMYSLVERAAELAGDTFLGAVVGSKLDLLAWEPISQAAEAAGTVGELLNRFIMNAKDHASSVQYRLEIAGNRATFSFRRVIEPPFDPAQNDAFYLGFMTRLVKSATGDAWEPESVLVTMSDPEVAPAEFRDMRIVKGDRLGFRIRMPTEWLFERFEKSSFGRRVKETGYALPPRTLVESVHRALAPHIHEGDLTVDRAAELCGIDKRRLARDLRDKGTTIKKEIDFLREERAKKALANSDQKILDIAAKVGFGDPTVFSRAFKGWTGESPQAFRKNSKLTKDQGVQQ